jgi:WD40 repeat protein
MLLFIFIYYYSLLVIIIICYPYYHSLLFFVIPIIILCYLLSLLSFFVICYPYTLITFIIITSNFAFKCHRDEKLVYPVNAISFHPTFGTFSTSGADGYIHTWDKDSRQRLESSVSLGSPIQATCFNRSGSLFAYSLGYDWFKGHEYYEASSKNVIKIHPVAENEVKPRQSAAFRRR